MTQVEETLAWEAEQRPRASASALIAGVCTLAGSLLLILSTNGGPTEDDGFVSLGEALEARLGGSAPDETSLRVRQADFLDDKLPQLYLSTILSTLAVIGACLAMLYLYRATKARQEETGRAPLIATALALGLYTVGHLTRDISTWTGVASIGGDARAGEVRDVANGGFAVAGQFLEQLGTFSLGLAFVLVSLNAMRAGLLTRFLGILGIIVGGLAILPLDQPQIVRAFWLVALGLMIGRAAAKPPAWETGRAMPWPSNQQIREARQQAAAGTNVPPSEPDAPVSTADVPAAAQKRKRKKRR